MRIIRSALTTTLTLLLLITVPGCSSTGSSNADNFPFPYRADREFINSGELKRILIAPVNLGKPSRKYLRPYEQRVDEFIEQRLQQAGYELVPAALFGDSWKTAVRSYGRPYDDSTGKLNEKAFRQIMHEVFGQLRSRGNIDAVLFTDLLEREVTFAGSSSNRMARWDGVNRKLYTEGTGTGVPTTFNWAQPVRAVSIWLNLYSLDLKEKFQSAGGIELTDALKMKGDPKFVRRKSVLANRTHIEEGVAIGLHPFVELSSYVEANPDKEPGE